MQRRILAWDNLGMFLSVTEKRLWIWAGVVVAGIYATLGLARTLSGVLRDRGMLDNTFFAGFIVILVALVMLALYTRPTGRQIGVALGAGAVYLMMFLRMGIPEERTHLIEYSVLAALIYAALRERNKAGGSIRFPGLLALGIATAFGFVDEVIQFFLPSRVFDWIDVGFNTLAATLAIATGAALIRLQDRRPGSFSGPTSGARGAAADSPSGSREGRKESRS